MAKKFIRFRPVNGKLEAEAIGFEGPACEKAIRDTLAKMKLTAVPGSEKQKPEFLLNKSQEKSVVTGK